MKLACGKVKLNTTFLDDYFYTFNHMNIKIMYAEGMYALFLFLF